ncbi:TldD/PmbA family protein [Palleronia caenipelagi]|uniref:TldD/PmbA family protein n=1 Tax=Palleronia caenipelagi TaxID=2489174 RepID=A0A547Q8A1_9RHOB|nr:TldD/PmbA family protein [Palleronia caenipelagi]TRD22605.1 TldD/PmbA family protein [Palleronia caenipelagi]
MSDTLARLSQDLLRAAQKAGAEAADAMAVRDASVNIDVRAGALEQAERSEGIEIGLRVILGQKQACVSASDISARTIEEMAERAVLMAREAPDDPGVGLADPSQLAGSVDPAALELVDDSPEPVPAALQEAALVAEAAALGVTGVTQCQSSSASWGRRKVFLAATNGFAAGYARTGSSISCVAISGEGSVMERDYSAESRIFASDLPDPVSIGRLAGERAAALQGARKAPTGAWPVLYDERISSGLIGHLLTAINGTSVARGASWALDLMDQRILPEGFDLIEEPLRKRISGSRPFDAEGLPTVTRPIVDSGHLSRWVLDLATARKLGLESTANAVRGPSAPPSPSVGNVTLSGPSTSRDKLLAEMGTGLLVTSLIGATINPNTGDYSRGASGFWVENGEITYPVNEITIAGNLREMLPGLRLADDARDHLSRRVPSLLVEGLMLAGA